MINKSKNFAAKIEANNISPQLKISNEKKLLHHYNDYALGIGAQEQNKYNDKINLAFDTNIVSTPEDYIKKFPYTKIEGEIIYNNNKELKKDIINIIFIFVHQKYKSNLHNIKIRYIILFLLKTFCQK